MSPTIGLDVPEEWVGEPTEVDKRLRTFPLVPGDLVAVIGGYGGWVCGMLMDNYPGIEVYTWEPQKLLFDALMRNEGHREKLHAFNYGLGVENGVFEMSNAGNDQCSFVRPYSPDETAPKFFTMGELRKVEEVFAELGLLGKEIALFHMNIEGYECYLVPKMVETGIFSNIKYFTLHTHGCETVDLSKGYCTGGEFRDKIGATHIWSWGFGEGIVGWRRKDQQPVDYSTYEFLARRGCDGDEAYGQKVIRRVP